MEEEKDFFGRQEGGWRSRLSRAPSRSRWWLVGLAVSTLTVCYSGSTLPQDPRMLLLGFQLTGVVEGLGLFFGSVAELLPEEQTTLAGILRVWAGLFVVLGMVLLAARFVVNAGGSGL